MACLLSTSLRSFQTIYETLVDCLRVKGVQISKLIGMGFDGAATFSGQWTFWRRVRLIQSLCTVTATYYNLPVFKQPTVLLESNVYITLTTLWKFVHYSPKRAKCLKEVQRVLNMPELKVIKPSDTSWLAHERCVKAVKENYIAICGCSQQHLWWNTPARSISKALSFKSTVSAVYLLDYVLLTSCETQQDPSI